MTDYRTTHTGAYGTTRIAVSMLERLWADAVLGQMIIDRRLTMVVGDRQDRKAA